MTEERSSEHTLLCPACGWFVRPEAALTRYERNEVAIDRHVETGHPIESVPTRDGTPVDGWAHEWPPDDTVD